MISLRNRAYPMSDRRNTLYGPAITNKSGGIEIADKFGTDLIMRSSMPPPVEEYDAYLKSRNAKAKMMHHATQKTGYRLRRIVIMRRQGSTWKECGEAVGVSGNSAKEWVEFLPYELAV